MRIVVYDVEFTKRVESLPNGWEDAKRGLAGVSACTVYDSETQRYHVYDHHTTAHAVDHVNAADLAVGFDCNRVDKPVLEGVTGLPIITPHFDIHHAIVRVIPKFQKGYRLTYICERTLGITKDGVGAAAPELVEQGRWGELFDYNINDVHLTRLLYNFIVENGYVIGVDGEPLMLSDYPSEKA